MYFFPLVSRAFVSCYCCYCRYFLYPLMHLCYLSTIKPANAFLFKKKNVNRCSQNKHCFLCSSCLYVQCLRRCCNRLAMWIKNTSTSYIDINSFHFHRFHHFVYYSDASIFLNKNAFHCHNILPRLLHTNLTYEIRNTKHIPFFCLPIDKIISHNG